MAERQFGPYRLVRQIAVGGMAEIHLAKTKGIAGFEKYVALKMIHPNYAEDEAFIQMLVDEAKIAVQLNHGNIAQTFDLGRVGDTFYITMEYVDGADLYKILRRGSEMDFEMPLDVCAYIAKDVASALDHAHRKRDHAGKTLGIVHRDVSPQNVLVSYSGEVKLVDFGIAKATMKARQTAVGVIKGKYYYMSPEQAWGDQLDYRSDIFSAGIVLYEMITGQMLYLEEDLTRLIEMVRKADIAPPSTLRKGIPPQLEKIVMHALAKDRRDRYQSAGDFATDLERFLHAHSPVFTGAKVAQMIKHVVGEPMSLPEEVEERDGALSTNTHALTSDDLIQDKEELEQDENSVIFRVADLRPKEPTESAKRQKQPSGGVPAAAAPAAKKAPARPRDKNEVTRQVEPMMPSTNTEDSGLLELDGPGPRKKTPSAWKKADGHSTLSGHEELEVGGESTMISGAPAAFGGFLMDNASEDGVEATQISSGPPSADDTNPDLDDGGTFAGETENDPLGDGGDDVDGEDGPTLERDFRNDKKPRATKARTAAAPPAALAAKIHAPAVSELRKPRASRKTPGTGMPGGNVLQAIVGAKPSEPMPAPAPQKTLLGQTSPLAQPLPPTPPPAPAPAPPPYPQGYPGYPPQGYPGYAQDNQGYSPSPVTPGALYPLQPSSSMPAMPMTMTGQLRLLEADEIGDKYKLARGAPRWLKIGLASVLAVSAAAAVTFFIIKATRDRAPTVASVHVESQPPGAEVVFDGTRIAGSTPLTIDGVPVGTRHDVRIELARYKPHSETVDIPKKGGEIAVRAAMVQMTGKLRVVTQPDGAEIKLDGVVKGRAPTTIPDIEMATAKKLELQLNGYESVTLDLTWPDNGEININQKLVLLR